MFVPPPTGLDSIWTLTHSSGFACARLHCGLPSPRAYGALSMDSRENPAKARVWSTALFFTSGHAIGKKQTYILALLSTGEFCIIDRAPQ
jgi:hypothetical protein